jgi:hypothetical protein
MRLIQPAMLGVAICALAPGSGWAADKSADEQNKTNISKAMRSEGSTFAELDKDKDGYISKAEAAADPALAGDFDKFDLNNDGKLNRAEYLAARTKEATSSVANKIMGKDNKIIGKDKAEPASSSGSSSKPKY